MSGIRQPEDVQVQVSGTVSASLRWNPGFSGTWNRRHDRAQKFVDSEVLRLGERFVPVRQGGLKRSGITGTVIGSGLVRYIAPAQKAEPEEGQKQGEEKQETQQVGGPQEEAARECGEKQQGVRKAALGGVKKGGGRVYKQEIHGFCPLLCRGNPV